MRITRVSVRKCVSGQICAVRFGRWPQLTQMKLAKTQKCQSSLRAFPERMACNELSVSFFQLLHSNETIAWASLADCSCVAPEKRNPSGPGLIEGVWHLNCANTWVTVTETTPNETIYGYRAPISTLSCWKITHNCTLSALVGSLGHHPPTPSKVKRSRSRTARATLNTMEKVVWCFFHVKP